MAEDVQPPEILAHLPCSEERNILSYVPSKAELGHAVGMEKPTASVAILDAGKAKPMIESFAEQIKKLRQ